MPIEFLHDDPRVIGLSAAAYGMLTRLLHHFWLTDCSPLPKDQQTLFVLSRAHKATWAQYRDDIRAILADAVPILMSAHERREHRLNNLKAMGVKGGSIIHLRSLQKKARAHVDDSQLLASRPTEHTRRREGEAKARNVPVKSDSGFAD